MNFLGIDIGTSAVKAILVDEDETVLAEAVSPVQTSYPEPGWAEQDPEDWWRACSSAVGELRWRNEAAMRTVRAIGLSGHMHAALMLDEEGRPVRPAILWSDGRAAAEVRLLERQVPDLAEIAGVGAMPGFTAPKLLWLQRNEPKVFARARSVLLTKDYIRFRLTGEIATDMSDAAGTLMLDEASRDWSSRVVSAVGVSSGALPALLEGPAWSGMVRGEVLDECGIDPPVPVAAGAGDVAAGAIGIGAINEGDAFISLGSATQVFVTRDRYRPRDDFAIHTFAHGLPGRWFEMAAMLNGTSCLDWLAGIAGAHVDKLVGLAEAEFSGPSPVMFLPYIAGERTPLNDPQARGAFAGLDEAHSLADMVQAVMEGVALSLAEAQEALGADLPSGPIPVIGGGTRSGLWLTVIASALDRPLLRVSGADVGPVLGAARLARMAATGGLADEVCVQPALIDIVDPLPELVDAFAERRETFRALYASLKEIRKAPEATASRRRFAKR